MKKFLIPLLFAASMSAATGDEGNAETAAQDREASSPNTDHIYLKASDGEPGYKKVAGEVESVTRNHVLFTRDGNPATYLYTREDVRRIDLGEDDEKAFRPTVDRHWNSEDILDRGKRSMSEWVSDLATSLVPGAILTGFLVLVGLYFLATTLLQAYQRFVLEGNLKRLNTEKLLSEIEKLQFEVFELRQRLGIAESDEVRLASADRPDYRIATADSDKQPPEERAGMPEIRMPEIRLPEVRFFDFVKTTILNINPVEVFETRKQELVEYWRVENTRNTGWFKLRYFVYNGTITAAIWFGWLLVVSLLGNIVGYFADPSYREIMGRVFITLITIIGIVLIVALIRLGQKRKLRRSAYRQVFMENQEDTPPESNAG